MRHSIGDSIGQSRRLYLERHHELLYWTLERPIFRGNVKLLNEAQEIGQVGFWAGPEGVVLGPTRETFLEIHPRWRGNGFGTKLVKGTVDYIQELMDHYRFSPQRVYAHTLIENVAAQKTFELSGFTCSSVRRSCKEYERSV